MVFKALVEAIIKSKVNPDDSLSQSVVSTLSRELRNDLIQAYDLSRPLINKNKTLFTESNSFLDFLLKLNQLPTVSSYKTNEDTHSVNLTALENKLQECKQSLSNKLDNMKQKNDNLVEKIDEYNREKDKLFNELQEKNKKINALDTEIRQLREKLDQKEDENLKSEYYVKQVDNSGEKFTYACNSRKTARPITLPFLQEPMMEQSTSFLPNTTSSINMFPPIASQSNFTSIPFSQAIPQNNQMGQLQMDQNYSQNSNDDEHLKSLEDANKKLTDEVENLKREIETEKNLNKKSLEQYSKLESRLNIEKEKYENLEKQSNEKIEKLTSTQQELENCIKNEKKCKEMMQKLENESECEKSLKNKIEELNLQVKNLKTLESDLKTCQAKEINLEREKEECIRSKEELENQIDKYKAQIEKLENENKNDREKTLLDTIKTLSNKIKELNQNLNEQKSLNAISNEKNEELERNLHEKITELQSIQAELNEYKSREQTNQDHIEELKNEIDKCKNSPNRSENYKQRKHSSKLQKNREKNRIILQQFREKYKNKDDVEDSFIREFDRQNDVLMQVDEQCQKLKTEADLVDVTPENFANQVINILNQNPNYFAKLEKIANLASLKNDDNLIAQLEIIFTNYSKYKTVIEQINCDLTVETLPEKIISVFQFLKNIVINFNPQSAQDKNWFSKFEEMLPFLTKALELFKSVYSETIQSDKSLKENWMENYTLIDKNSLDNLKEYETILQETSNLFLNYPIENNDEWKASFQKRCKILFEFASNFFSFNSENFKNPNYVDDSLNEVTDFLTQFATFLNFEIFKNSEWMKLLIRDALNFISQLRSKYPYDDNFENWKIIMLNNLELSQDDVSESKNSKSTLMRKTANKRHLVLEKQCKSLLRNFYVLKRFNYKTFETDMMKSDFVTKCNENFNLSRHLEAYFDIKNVTFSDIFSKIDTSFSTLNTKLNIPIPNKSSFIDKITFENHFHAYYTEIMKYVETLQNDLLQFNNFYRDWSKKLKQESSSKQQFLEYLMNVLKNKQKRAFVDRNDEEGFEKKCRLSESWSVTEIQTLFYMLYKAYFKLKFNELENRIPNIEEIRQEIIRKLEILEKITSNYRSDKIHNIRENELLNTFEEYVYYDLEKIVGEKKRLSHEELSKDQLLDQCMAKTKKYLEMLFEKKCQEVNDNEDVDFAEEDSEDTDETM